MVVHKRVLGAAKCNANIRDQTPLAEIEEPPEDFEDLGFKTVRVVPCRRCMPFGYFKRNDVSKDMIFPHKCIIPDCNRMVELDDEPWCFEHSPDSGSALPGYSARRAAKNAPVEHKNVFDKED